MVVDLQGALTVDASNGKREFVLTDPAIHKRRRDGTGTGLLRTINFGRTNRGHKGMQAFFETHCCNDVCRMLGLPEEAQAKPQPTTPSLPTVASSNSGDMSV
jgi:Alpha-kinase family